MNLLTPRNQLSILQKEAGKGDSPKRIKKGVENMKEFIKKTMITSVTMIGLTAPAFGRADTTLGNNGYQQRSSVEAVCQAETDDLTVIVTSQYGYDYMEVYDGHRLVESNYADKDYSYSGGTLIVSYKTGPITRGGASLRIRSFDSDAANLEGYGHLTIKTGGRFVNKLMNCFIY